MKNLAAAPAAGNFPPLRPQGVLHHGRSPFFTTSASEFFIPLAGAVFMTSKTSSSPPRTVPMPRIMPPRKMRGSHLAAAPAAGNFHPLRPQGILHHGRNPFFTTSASEFFIPLAGAVIMTSETSPSPPKKLPRAMRAKFPAEQSSPCAARTIKSRNKKLRRFYDFSSFLS